MNAKLTLSAGMPSPSPDAARCSACHGLSIYYTSAMADRRSFLKATVAASSLALSLVAPVTALAEDATEAQKNARPKDGDVFVFASGEKQGQVVAPADIAVGTRPIFVWPMDQSDHIIRDGSRLNQLLLIRLDPTTLDEVTKAHSADGIVAYSAVCTHQLCPVSGWSEEKQALHCPCHQSEFDPRQNGMRVFGPAPRSLPALPVKIVDGTLKAAGTFLSTVGRPSA